MADPTPKSPQNKKLLLALVVVVLLVGLFGRNQLAGIANSRAQSNLEHRDLDGAVWWLGVAKSVSKQNPRTEMLLARVCRRRGELVDAKAHLDEAAKLGLADYLQEREQWLSLAQAGRIQEAEPHLVSLLEDPGRDGPEICEAYAIGYLKNRQFDQAERLVNAWVGDYPRDAQPHYYMGVMLRESDNWEEAEASLRRALALEPSHSAAALQLGDVLTERKQTEDALQFYRQADRGAEHVDAVLGQVKCLRALGKPADARQLLVKLDSEQPRPQVTLVLAQLDLDDGDNEAAYRRLEPLIPTQIRDLDFRYALATAMRGIGKSDEALEHFEAVKKARSEIATANRLGEKLAANPDDVELRHQIGMLHLQYGNQKEGLMWLLSVLNYDPDHQATHLALAEHYESRQFEDANFLQQARYHRSRCQQPSTPPRIEPAEPLGPAALPVEEPNDANP